MDESGLLLAPTVRRSWAPKGHPSEIRPSAGHRHKVSVAGALWLSPSRRRLGLFFETIADGYFNSEAVAAFVTDLLRQLHAPAVVIWDGGTMHKGDPIEELRERQGSRLRLELLPAHTPELMPMEEGWSWLKYDQLSNFVPEDVQALEERVLGELDAIQDNQELLQSFFHQSKLPLPRALLF
jgi:putative transposase